MPKMKGGDIVPTWIQMSRSPEYSPAILGEELLKVSTNFSDFKNSVGEVAFFDRIEKAMLGNTVIIGGFLNTDLIAANSILAEKLDVRDLSAISADIGDITSGRLTGTLVRTSPDGDRIELSDNLLSSYLNSVKRVQLDYDSLDFYTDNSILAGSLSAMPPGEYGVDASLTLSGFDNTIIESKKSDTNFASVTCISNHPQIENTVILAVQEGGASTRTSFRITPGIVQFGRSNASIYISGTTEMIGDLSVSGTKSRVVETENYDDVLHYALETPTPLFMDVGQGQISEDGLCYVDIESIFVETVDLVSDYHIQLTKYGQGDIWVKEKQGNYFIIEGTPGLKFAWEIKAKQKGYSNERLEKHTEPEHNGETDYEELASEYLESYEKELMPA